MWPYLLLMAAPGGPAIMAVRRAGLLFLAIALLFWFSIGLRFHVGVDWNNYLHLYSLAKGRSFGDLITQSEPAFRALLWLGSVTGGGMILVNALSALIFCWGFFAIARRCREPFMAITVGAPLVAVAAAMSGIRQAAAMGIIYYLFATWEKRGSLARTGFVVLASLFHFSAVFTGVFVALESRLTPLGRIAVAALILMVTFGAVWFFPDRFQFYLEAYAGEERVSAPGAIAHVGILALPALLYFTFRRRWREALGESTLVRNLAIAAILMLPAVAWSSVGAYRLSLYFWPVAMYVWSGMPALMQTTTVQYMYRVAVVIGSILMLVFWLEFANSGWAYVPYRNWVWQPENVSLFR